MLTDVETGAGQHGWSEVSVSNGGLHGQVLDQLGEAICGDQLPPGTLLSVDELMEQFKVSRSVVREALRVLASMGVVSSTRGVGTVTLDRSQWNVLDPSVVHWRLAAGDRAAQLASLVELRAAVEPAAARLAAQRADPGEASQLVMLSAKMWEASRLGHGEEFLRLDIEFHALVLLASRNEMFHKLGPMVAEVLSARTQYGLVPPFPHDQALRLHSDLALAIQRGEAERAEELSEMLLADAVEELERLLDGKAEDGTLSD